MTCVCGHSDDLHNLENEDERIYGCCQACPCTEFSDDIDMDELETE